MSNNKCKMGGAIAILWKNVIGTTENTLPLRQYFWRIFGFGI